MDIALGAIFVLGIGLSVVASVISDGNFTGLTATVLGFTTVIVAAGFLYMVSKKTGMSK